MGFVLGLHGGAGAGKDSIADYLISKYSWDRKTAFSKNLKQMCRDVFKLTEEQTETQAGKKRNFDVPIIFTKEHFASILYIMLRTHSRAANREAKERWIAALKKISTEYFGRKLHNPREVIQFVGTDVCRELCLTYHIDILMADVSSSVNHKVIIPDVRFANEAEALLTLPNSLIISVTRENLPDLNMNRGHSSETSMKDWDKFGDKIFISKDKDGIEFLYEEVDNFLERNNLCHSG